MATFLQLVNRARVECGISGAHTDLTSLQGTLPLESKRIMQWVQQAWIELQTSAEDWQFLRNSFEFNTVQGTWSYAPTASPVSLSDFGNWKLDSLRVSTQGQAYADEQLIAFMDYETFRNLYRYAAMRTTQSRPTVFSVAPDKSLVFGPVPDRAYTVNGEYFKKPQTLSADADEPTGLPDRFHLLVVYEAMKHYAQFESAPEVFARAEAQAGKLKAQLEIDRMQFLTPGAPLA